MITFDRFLSLHAATYPEKCALVFKEKKWVYRDFNSRVNRLANGLLDLGARKGDRVGILLHNGNEIAESVFDLGIKMSFEFNPNQHDRFIQADNGWKIVLGRGLDIFLKPEGKFNVADLYQEKRKCRATEITYLKLV